ncbi:MAG: hypothetical protein AAGE92_08305 [Cyanobacteria bacterium P01_G01_bin.4]
MTTALNAIRLYAAQCHPLAGTLANDTMAVATQLRHIAATFSPDCVWRSLFSLK